MALTVLIAAFGLLVLVLLVHTTRRRAADISQYDSLTEQLEPVPISALLNLVDPAQQEYLQLTLSKIDFFRLQRMRNRALLAYVRSIYRNAGILLNCAHAAAQSERADIAEAGRELLNLALFTRTEALRSMVMLTMGLVVPRAAANLFPMVAKYASATARSTSLAAVLNTQPATA